MASVDLRPRRKFSTLFSTLLGGTLLAVVVFFAISFLTVLRHITPVHRYKPSEAYKLAIGFPWTYYYQFWVRGEDLPQFGWHVVHLGYDCLLTWLVVLALYLLWKRTAGTRHS
ncbi:hypothetical protein [Hymenobacter perfusus]|uniref:Uncharacterized protein n=1 Tax=Hymenobacter perfusus TaxID=1236770 RepID=A0A3R9NP40_9BACT|nr:hypothetical protein [Hymenobacter perfusus]RSK38411.1 hypothetical protein EI293_21575 [Hymenobacter perfusus]